MAKFRGRFDFSIDQKGRINIPSKFRKMLAPEAEETFVICRAPGGCLWAYPKDEWEKFEDSLLAIPVNEETDRFQRAMQNTLSDSTLDKQGRITITQLQMEIAGITKEASIIGRGCYLEIWNTKKFAEYNSDGDNYDEAYYKIMKSRVSSG
jgi:MraZ protein